MSVLKEFFSASAFSKHMKLTIVGNVDAFMRHSILASLEAKRFLDKLNVDNNFSFDN